MPRATTRYIVDERGRKKGIVLDLKEYRRLLKRLEEMEDTLDLDEAVRSAHSFADYETVRKEFKQEGRL
ncbi:MAG: hypothetical protein HYY00_04155 [Chloroflexi bacterium]|nr:hypothetical protein [Chloroflexota bacterium]